jgi:hypothetical protein
MAHKGENMKGITNILLAIFLLSVSSFAKSEDIDIRSYQLPKHGAIQFKVPKSWHAEVRQPPNSLPPTITFTPESGETFQVLLTIGFPLKKEDSPPDLTQLKSSVEHAAKEAQGQAVESHIEIKELNDRSTVGYYFTATDKAPNPGEFKYMTQGALKVGELFPLFTILTNEGSNNVIAISLEMLKSAIQIQNAP